MKVAQSGVANNKDYLWLQIKEMPYFRGILRAVEARFYQEISLIKPILDLGCGDGHFASVAFNGLIDFGIDPWRGPVKLAKNYSTYDTVINGLGNQLPFPDGYFSTVISNSVLEHIEDLDAVIEEVNRVLKPNGTFIFCVPNQNFLANLSISNFFDQIGLKFLGDRYRNLFNFISRHHHCDSPEIWDKRLARSGFYIDRWWHYFSPKALHVLEWGHYFGLPSLICHFLFKKWIIVPEKWNLIITDKITRKIYQEDPEHENGSYTFYVTHKTEQSQINNFEKFDRI